MTELIKDNIYHHAFYINGHQKHRITNGLGMEHYIYKLTTGLF